MKTTRLIAGACALSFAAVMTVACTEEPPRPTAQQTDEMEQPLMEQPAQPADQTWQQPEQPQTLPEPGEGETDTPAQTY